MLLQLGLAAGTTARWKSAGGGQREASEPCERDE
jgi:hypothetical protein